MSELERLSRTRNDELIAELRNRGLAVVAFCVEDCAEGYDYGDGHQKMDWFLDARQELEERLQEFGNNELDRLAAAYPLPDADSEEV